MQEQSQAPGTWRIGFDLAAFVLLATIAGMAAAVTLASIALFLSGAMSGTPATTSGAPATIPGTPATRPNMPATSPGIPDKIPGTPATAPDDQDAPSSAPGAHTEVAHGARPANLTAAASAGRGAASSLAALPARLLRLRSWRWS
jgi:hypothetical protein